jgi:uncharacterized protein RhaS with RHS repeats
MGRNPHEACHGGSISRQPDANVCEGDFWEESYYRARYYDPIAGRFIGEDPLGFGGGADFYAYVENNPVFWIDPLGLECHTFVFWTRCNQAGESPTLIAAENAHEAQHREDNKELLAAAGLPGLAAARIPRVCQLLEARGFAKEIPILEKRINELKTQKCRTKQEEEELQELENELSRAKAVSSDRKAQKVYCMSH